MGPRPRPRRAAVTVLVVALRHRRRPAPSACPSDGPGAARRQPPLRPVRAVRAVPRRAPGHRPARPLRRRSRRRAPRPGAAPPRRRAGAVPTRSPACCGPGEVVGVLLDRDVRQRAHAGAVPTPLFAPAFELGVPVVPVALVGRELGRRLAGPPRRARRPPTTAGDRSPWPSSPTAPAPECRSCSTKPFPRAAGSNGGRTPRAPRPDLRRHPAALRHVRAPRRPSRC